MNSKSPSVIVVGLALLAAGFAWGFLSGTKKLFPHGAIQSVLGRLGGEGPDGNEGSGEPRRVQTSQTTGWFNPLRESGPTADEVASGLGDLGYAETYQLAGDVLGVVVNDAARAQPGLNLIVSAHEPTALLADMEGETLHSWSYDFADVPIPDGYELPGTFGMRYFRRAALLDDGELLVVFDRTGMLKLDRDSNLVWSSVDQYHHDLDVTQDGTIWVLTHDVHVVPRIHQKVAIFEDFITRVSPDGEVLGEVSVLEAFENSDYASFLANLTPGEIEAKADIFHTNTIEVFEGELAHLSPHFRAGHVLLSIWGLDVVAIVDPEAVEVVWAISGMWHRQHEPVILESGNMLLFDNMGHRGMSKVIEIEPFTQEIVWAYEGDERNGFYSALCGSNQRLANGNTLITESLAGHAFEVTPDGDVVWDYHSPFRVMGGPNGDQEGVAVLMEVIRLDPASVDWLDR